MYCCLHNAEIGKYSNYLPGQLIADAMKEKCCFFQLLCFYSKLFLKSGHSDLGYNCDLLGIPLCG